MMSFKDFISEDKTQDSKSTLLTYITNSFVKLANADKVNQVSWFLLLGATVLATFSEGNSTQLSKKLVQLALSKANTER